MSQGQKVNLYSRVPSVGSDGNDSALDFSTVRLLELPESILQVIESANPPDLVIKPSAKGTAILSTPTKSFLLRAVSQSNSLMLFVPSETDGFDLVHTAKEYLEVIPNPARVALDPAIPLWDGESMDVDGTRKLTMYELRRSIATSDLEIDEALKAVFAVDIDGYVYRMTTAYVNQLLDLIIATTTADSIPLDNLNPTTLLTSLSTDDRPECIHAILKFFSTTPYPPYSLPASSLQRWYAIRTLQSHPAAQQISSFLQSWQLSLPSILPPTQDLSLLRGEVFYPTPKTIQYLPQGELAVVPEHRFAQLFGVKEKWALEEILPFLEGCVEGGPGWEKRAEKECQKWARVRGGQVMKR